MKRLSRLERIGKEMDNFGMPEQEDGSFLFERWNDLRSVKLAYCNTGGSSETSWKEAALNLRKRLVGLVNELDDMLSVEKENHA